MDLRIAIVSSKCGECMRILLGFETKLAPQHSSQMVTSMVVVPFSFSVFVPFHALHLAAFGNCAVLNNRVVCVVGNRIPVLCVSHVSSHLFVIRAGGCLFAGCLRATLRTAPRIRNVTHWLLSVVARMAVN